ncbi:MAG: hypothetical protein V4508_26590 [Pseudomonadota bacterium]
METYDFVDRNLKLADVKSIIAQAKYDSTDYSYTARVSNDGYVVKGTVVMSTTVLRTAAKTLKIKVEISSAFLAQATSGGLGGTPYKLHFTMDEATLDALQGSMLVVFKGVKSPGTKPSGAAPLAWIVSDTFGKDTKIDWHEDYAAYTSIEAIIPNGVITASNPASITVGETYNVVQSGGGEVVASGQANAMSIHNLSDRQFSCGIAQTPAGSTEAQAICAFNLYGGSIDVIIPEEKIFMMFVSGTVDTGTVYENSVGRGLFVDLTGVVGRDGISYDINKGWDWGKHSWAAQYPASSDLVPLLIDSSTTVKHARSNRLALAA